MMNPLASHIYARKNLLVLLLSLVSVCFTTNANMVGLSLIIETEWEWNTFLGGSEKDEGTSIAVDDSGNVYIAGFSDATWGSPINAHAGNNDAFVAKLNSSGALQWNTFLGGSNTDYGEMYYVGEIFTLEDVEKMLPGRRILISNMKSNNYKRVVKTKFGQWFPLEERDIVITDESKDATLGREALKNEP